MPMIASVMRVINRRFDYDEIGPFSQNAALFAPGAKLDVGALSLPSSKITKAFQAYVDQFPKGLQEVLRGSIYYALSAKPPIPISFAWAPGYSFELAIWEPECGLTIMLKGPMPKELKAGKKQAAAA